MLEQIGIIIVLNLILYFRTLSFKFVSDDFSVWKNPPIARNGIHRLWLQITGQMKFYAKGVRFMRSDKKWFVAIVRSEELEHLVALILHICICISVHLAFGLNWVSFLTALLYSVNPINNQGTIWPSGRGYVYPILFLLLAMAYPILSPLFLFCGTWYTAGFLSPLSLIGSEHIWMLSFVPVIWFIHSRKFVTAVRGKQESESFTEDKIIHPKKLILAIKTFGFYSLICIIPFRITFYHNFLQSAAGSLKHKAYSLCRYFWVGLLSIIGMVSWMVLTPWNTISWALLTYFLMILPFCNFRRSTQEIAERFVSLPNVFLMYALAQVIYAYPLVVTALIAFYVTRTYYTVIMYRDDYFITECAVIEDPHAWWAWHCRAMKRWDTQSYREALILWVMAKLISPKEFKVLMNIATCLRLLKNNKEADSYLRLAEENIVPGQEKEARQYIENHKKGNLPILL